MDAIAEFDAATDDGGSAAHTAHSSLYYASVAEFVGEYLADLFHRRYAANERESEFQWCAQWWRHPEAVSRLDALWLAWEQMRLEGGTAMSAWWRDYADPTMRALFQSNGTFEGCTPDRHAPKGRALPVVQPPAGLFD